MIYISGTKVQQKNEIHKKKRKKITPKTKVLPPQVVRYLCEKYDIEI